MGGGPGFLQGSGPPSSKPGTAPDPVPGGARSGAWLPVVAGCVVLVAVLIGVLAAVRPWDDKPGDRAASTSTVDLGPNGSGPGENAAPPGETSTGPSLTTIPASESTLPRQSLLTMLPGGSWLMVLESIPYADGIDAAQSYQDEFLRSGYRTSLIDTADHPGLTPGYYAVVLGPFSSRSMARTRCGDAGRELGGTCYDRFVE